MKSVVNALVVLFVPLAALTVRGGDIHDDAVVWLRGDSDVNDDGVVQNGEVVDARSPTQTGVAVIRGWQDGTVSGMPGDFRWTNDVVTVPYTFRTVPSARNYCFRQSVNSGNSGVWPSVIELPDVASKITSENWSFHLRFKWDGRPISSKTAQQYVLVAGKDTTSDVGHGMSWSIANAGDFVCLIGETAFMSYSVNVTRIESNKWTDVVFVFKDDGAISLTVMQEGGDLISKTVTCSDKKYRPNPEKSFFIGNLTATSGWGYYVTSANVYQAFRGQINRFAVWNRSLSEDEVKRVLAWPNEDLFRAGVADGSSAEFDGAGETSALALDADAGWSRFGGNLAAGSSKAVSVAVPVRYHGLPQVLRVCGAADSAAGTLELNVNGTVVCSNDVRAGAWTYFPIAGGYFESNTVTTLTLTRTDTGAAAVKLDTLALGGSWQEGTISNNQYENGNLGTVPESFYVPNGDFSDFLNAAHIGQDMKLTFDIPGQMADRFLYRLVLRNAFYSHDATDRIAGIQNVKFVTYVNGTKIFTDDTRSESGWKMRTLDIPYGLLKSGENVIRFANEGDPDGVDGFFSFDYLQFHIGDPAPSCLLILIK